MVLLLTTLEGKIYVQSCPVQRGAQQENISKNISSPIHVEIHSHAERRPPGTVPKEFSNAPPVRHPGAVVDHVHIALRLPCQGRIRHSADDEGLRLAW